MSKYYVELATSGSVVPVAVDAATLLESKKVASRQFHQQLFPRFATSISSDTAGLFDTVEHWKEDTQLISPEIFRVTIAKLLREGCSIADGQWEKRAFSLVSPRPEYEGVSSDDIAVLMNCPTCDIHGTQLYTFNKNEALMFMALIIREGIARRITELVRGN